MRLENEQLYLVKKGYAHKLIYEVFFQETGESIGTCHVLEIVGKKKDEQKIFVVQEFVAKSPKLKKRLKDIEKLVRDNF